MELLSTHLVGGIMVMMMMMMMMMVTVVINFEFPASGMLRCVVTWVIPDVSKLHIALRFFRLPPLYQRDLTYFGILRSVDL